MRPDDVLRSECLKIYGAERDMILYDLMRINTHLRWMKKLEIFPFRIVGSEEIFWNLTYFSFLEVTLLMIHRVALDEGKGTLTLMKFADTIKKQFAQDDDRQKFEHRVSSSELARGIDDVRNRIANLRNNKIAHISRGKASDKSFISDNRVSLEELERLRDVLYEFFLITCLGEEYTLDFFPYHSEEYTMMEGPLPASEELDYLLDNVADRSPVLRMPEDDQWLWNEHRKDISADDIRAFNEYRRKFNLESVR